MRRLLLLGILMGGLIWSGCATSRARHSGKVGLFDRILSSKGSKKRVSSDSWQETLGEDRVEAVDEQVSRWSPPLRHVQVTSHFGMRGGDYHDGVDLRAREGTPVFAVDDGVVAYAGAGIGGYGRMVVLRHAGGLSTVYAHNSKLLVARGKRVRKGQRIALSGRTGRSRGAHLHFEVRSGITAVDPLALGKGPWWNRTLAEYKPKSSGRRPASVTASKRKAVVNSRRRTASRAQESNHDS
jgi:murein DD-endopeptidase MepM/ murein hydrolase activator NlpD